MVPLDEHEFDRWRAAAERATGAAAVHVDTGYFEWACFLFEQAAQLAVKGILHGVGAGAWGHDLAALTAVAPEAVGPSWPSSTAAPAERLARFYLPARYPDALPGGVPGDRFSEADAANASADCQAMLAAVDTAWTALLSEGQDDQHTREDAGR